jgi:hypothetical protein
MFDQFCNIMAIQTLEGGNFHN